jgi:hypothetical protein
MPSMVSNISESKFIIYPNPTLGKVHINTLSQNLNTIMVYNILGSLVYFENLISEKEIELDLSHLKKGLYHIRVRSNNGVENHKILIE